MAAGKADLPEELRTMAGASEGSEGTRSDQALTDDFAWELQVQVGLCACMLQSHTAPSLWLHVSKP